MAPERRNRILLAALAVILVAIVFYQLRARPAIAPPASSNPAAGRGNQAARAAGAPRSAPQVDLQALGATRPEPMIGERNLFRFKPKPPPAPPPIARGPRPPTPGPETRPGGPASPPPINLKFIGILEAPESGKKIAALSDGRHVYQGVEGGIILGQYRILHIGNESIELAYLDGRGKQTIRLTGG